MPDRDHTFIQLLKAQGDRFGVLFSYAKGQKKHILPVETHFKIGQLIAKLHQVTLNRTIKRINYTPEVMLVDSLKQISLFLTADTEEMNFMRSTQRYLLEEFAKADTAQIRQGIVHLDIWFDNLNLTEKNEITLFDFDFCGNGWLCLDIAYYILQLHNIERYEAKDYQPKVDSFMKGYESVNSVSEEEKRLIPMLGVSLYFFYLGVQCQRYENWSNSFLNENYLKRYINGLVKKYCGIHRLGEYKIE